MHRYVYIEMERKFTKETHAFSGRSISGYLGTARTNAGMGTKISVQNREGKELISYEGKKPEIEKIPDPATEAPLPKDAKTTEDLYLYGKHLEQYRHATYEPADYYLEGLRRDETDVRLNNAYGSLLFRRGKIKESEKYFRQAIEKLTRSNPNPENGEPLYNLGLCLKFQGRLSEAYDAFYKATWNGAWQGTMLFIKWLVLPVFRKITKQHWSILSVLL